METTTIILIGLAVVVGLPLVVTALIAYAVASSVNSMRGGAQVEPAGRPQAGMGDEIVRRYRDWVQRNRMEFVGYYTYQAVAPVLIAVWQCPRPTAYFCVYLAQQKHYLDLVSLIDERTGATLTTSNTKETMLLPRPPGSYAQSFPASSPDELMKHHIAAQQYLRSTKRIHFQHSSQRFELVLQRAIDQQVKYVRQIPLYPLRGVWWYFVSRHTLSGKSIEQQHREGLWQ